MDASLITPFVTSIQNVFSTMLQLPVTVNTPKVKSNPEPSHDVSGIIGMSGDVTGSVVLSFPLETAKRVVALFCGEQMDPRSADFSDAIGELVNMVSGGAKAQFPDNKKVSISCPSVVLGENHVVATQTDTPCVLIPCSTDCGELTIEIAIREREGAGSSQASQQATA